MIIFHKIRLWAIERNLYKLGDIKTQTIKLQEEVGELSAAVLKNDIKKIHDAIGDIVVVLTNLSQFAETSIESCINLAYEEIKNRKGKMENGTFQKK